MKLVVFFLKEFIISTKPFLNLNWHNTDLKISYDGTTAQVGSDTQLGYGVGMTFDVPNLDGKIIIGYEVLDTEWV